MAGTPDSTFTNPEQRIADLQRQLAEREAELAEAREQQAAIAEVLQVINSSPGDLKPVFEAVLEKALALCDASFGSVYTRNDEHFERVVSRGLPTEYMAAVPSVAGPFSPGGLFDRILGGESVISIPDLAEPEVIRLTPRFEPLVRLAGARSYVGVALRKDEQPLGLIAIYRRDVRAFTDKQTALLQNFAAQAVIAIENARLITETREALDQQTATAEVLQVINSSPGDLAPVFDAMLEKATALCDAVYGNLLTYDGNRFHHAALRGTPPAYAEFMREHPPNYGPGTSLGQLALGARLVHVVDLTDTDSYRSGDPNRRAIADLAGARTLVAVPLRKDATFVGAIVVFRREVRPFTDKQIALLENFAAQAVIAMENARLLGELQARTRDLEESLEYQTATSDVLNVISRSTADVQPVLDTVAETATRLCGADSAGIWIREGEVYRYVSGHAGDVSAADAEYWARVRQRTLVPGRDSVTGRVALEGGIVHIEDTRAIPDYAVPESAASGRRTALGVPLLREGAVLGTINLTRKRVEPFTERQIELVRTFADQAVIAIENTRLLTELRERTRDLQESLEYQTATSDVLKVISRSTFDLQPVLNTLVDTAARPCRADMAHIRSREGDVYRSVASFAYSPEFEALARSRAVEPSRGTIAGRVALERRVVHVTDIAADPEYEWPAIVSIGQVHTALGVPLLRGGEPIGVITLYRRRVEPFTERQIELVRTFADQAVIAIENV